MNEAVKVGVSNDTMSILELILQASLLVQIVILLLILASLASWVVIFTKSSTLKNLRLESDNFDSEFWSGVNSMDFTDAIPRRKQNPLEWPAYLLRVIANTIDWRVMAL